MKLGIGILVTGTIKDWVSNNIELNKVNITSVLGKPMIKNKIKIKRGPPFRVLMCSIQKVESSFRIVMEIDR